MNFGSFVGAAVLAIAIAGSASAATNLVVNGDFESTTNGADKGLRGELTMVTGWTLQNPNSAYGFVYAAGSADTTGAIDPERLDTVAQLWGPGNGTNNGLVNVSPTGGNFLAIDADPPYAPHLTQDLTGLTVGKSYDVSFYWAAAQFRVYDGAEWHGATNEQLTVGFGNQSQSTAVVNIDSHGFAPWAQVTFRFVADSATQTLSFLANGGPGGLPPAVLLDGVSVNAVVPEPQTWAMLIAGFGLVGATARRRRAKAVAA